MLGAKLARRLAQMYRAADATRRTLARLSRGDDLHSASSMVGYVHAAPIVSPRVWVLQERSRMEFPQDVLVSARVDVLSILDTLGSLVGKVSLLETAIEGISSLADRIGIGQGRAIDPRAIHGLVAGSINLLDGLAQAVNQSVGADDDGMEGLLFSLWADSSGIDAGQGAERAVGKSLQTKAKAKGCIGSYGWVSGDKRSAVSLTG